MGGCASNESKTGSNCPSTFAVRYFEVAQLERDRRRGEGGGVVRDRGLVVMPVPACTRTIHHPLAEIDIENRDRSG